MSNLAELKKAMTKEVVGPFTGITFKIRKLRTKELMNYMSSLPIRIAKPVQEDLEQFAKSITEEATKNPEIEVKADQYMLERAVLSPKIFLGDPESCPEDQVPYAYLGNDIDILLMNILHLTNNAPDLGGSVIADAFLQNSSNGSAGPSGEEVLVPPVEPTPEGHV
jgi:hypothetical protein